MFSVETKLFSNLPPHEVGRFPTLDEAVAFAQTRIQFALEMWIESAGVVVVKYE
jgi:hypothetical protein